MVPHPSFESLLWFEKFCQRTRNELEAIKYEFYSLLAPKAALAIDRKLHHILSENTSEVYNDFGVSLNCSTTVTPNGTFLADISATISLWYEQNLYRLSEVLFIKCVNYHPEHSQEISWSKEGF
jgi:hypothetical protein